MAVAMVLAILGGSGARAASVDDVDPNGKVSLTPTSPLGGGEGGGSSEGGSSSSDDGGSSSNGGVSRDEVSFEDAFDAEIREEFGELGPGQQGGGDRGGDRGGRSGGGRGGDRGGRGGGRRGGGRR